MRSRMLTLILAIVTGAVAVAIVYVYVQQVEDETARGQRMVEVLVADQTLEAGTKWTDIVESQLARIERIPEKYAAPGALGSAQDRPGAVLARDVVVDEQLTFQAFETTVQNAFHSQFKDGTQGLAVEVEHVRGVAGHVVAGDRLNAFETTDQEGTTIIGERLKVIEVQPAGAGDPAGLDKMVLQVTQPQAVDLINAQEQAGLWFTLIPGGGQ